LAQYRQFPGKTPANYVIVSKAQCRAELVGTAHPNLALVIITHFFRKVYNNFSPHCARFRFIGLFDNTPSRGGGAQRAGVKWKNVPISHTRHGYAVPPSPRRGYAVRNQQQPDKSKFAKKIFQKRLHLARLFAIIAFILG